jgi:hypothetical protein
LAEDQEASYKKPSIKSDDIISSAAVAEGPSIEQQEDKEEEQAEYQKLFTKHNEAAAAGAECQYAENKDFGIIASASAFLAEDQGQEQQRWGKKLFVNDRKADAAAEATAMRMMHADYDEARAVVNSPDSSFGDADGGFGAGTTAAAAAEDTANRYEVVDGNLMLTTVTNDGGT